MARLTSTLAIAMATGGHDGAFVTCSANHALTVCQGISDVSACALMAVTSRPLSIVSMLAFTWLTFRGKQVTCTRRRFKFT
jgi:hypothetical protein